MAVARLNRYIHMLGMKTSGLLVRGMNAAELVELLDDMAEIHRDFVELGGVAWKA